MKNPRKTRTEPLSQGYYDVTGIAAHFNVSERTIWRYANAGSFPKYRIGRSVRFKISDVEAALFGVKEGATA